MATAEQKVTLTGNTNTANKIYKVTELTNENAVTIGPYYKEYVTGSGNIAAKDLKVFLKSALTNGGYYIARYEAAEGTAGGSRGIKTVSGVTPKTYINQSTAASLARAMYESDSYVSDLVNSYAWDTAIQFIQTYGTGANANVYSKCNMGPSASSSRVKTGESSDRYCNIFDLSGNYWEWTTEFSAYDSYVCVNRGGDGSGGTHYYPSGRDCHNTGHTYYLLRFPCTALRSAVDCLRN